MSSPEMSLSSMTTASNLRSAQPGDRQRGLDLLRALGAILVVMLHVGMPYLTHPLPGLIWSADSPDKSRLVTMICWTINGFIMPLFFLMSGFMAAQLAVQLGNRGFLTHRLKRLGQPFLLACCLILPMDLYVWVLGWVAEGSVPWKALRRLSFPEQYDTALWGLAHLWYLGYLLIYCVAAWGLRELWSLRRQLSPPTLRFQRRPFLPAPGLITLSAACLLAGTVLWWQPRIVIGFRNAFYPLWENLLYYAIPFALGWFWKQQLIDKAPGSTQVSAVRLLVGAGLVGCLLILPLKWHLEQETQPAAIALAPYLFATFGLLMTAGLFQLALNFPPGPLPAFVRFLAKASFWIYLFHHPLTGLINIDFKAVRWDPFLEFVLSTGIVLGLCLATFEVGVRRTWLGKILNGVQEPPRPPAVSPAQAPAADQSRAA